MLIESFKEHMNDKFSEVNKRLDGVNDHLKTLNGKVAANTFWRGKIQGGLIILSVIFTSLLVPLYLSYLQGKFNPDIESMVSSAVEAALEEKYGIITSTEN